MNQESKESVLSRWSRHKLEAERLESASADPVKPTGAVDQTLPAVEEADAVEKPLLTDADMPDIKSLDEDSDFSGFMSAGVSDRLRNMALRKLFMAPVFNVRDGLDEYDEDYTSFEKLGDIVTCDMKHQIEMEEQKRREMQAAEAEAGEQFDVENNDRDAMEAEEGEVEAELSEQPGTLPQAGQESEPGSEADDD